jgi:hypothetical protein
MAINGVDVKLITYSLIQEKNMDANTIRERVALIEGKRESLVKLLEKPDLGTLRIDVNQALEEIDELIEEFKRTFPNLELN